MQTLYATFLNPSDAEKAAGALLDNGVRSEDITVIQHHSEKTSTTYINDPTDSPTGESVTVVETTTTPAKNADVEDAAKHGISTTTAGDAGIGAAKGAGWGVGIGTAAAIASLFIPGVGLVVGGGALAIAIGAAAAATGAGAVAGAVTGYLKDQGFEEKDIERYEKIVVGGGAVLAVSLPSGVLDEPNAWEIINKYNGTAFTRGEALRAAL